MATSRSRITFRVVLAILVIVGFFYLFRPLYWKISATIQDIRHNKQTVSGGLSKIVYEAQKSVGNWYYHDESNSGTNRKSAARKILRQVFY